MKSIYTTAKYVLCLNVMDSNNSKVIFDMKQSEKVDLECYNYELQM
jgi:hypothetical protein